MVRYLLSPSSLVLCVAHRMPPGALAYHIFYQGTRNLDWESKGLNYATINYDEPSTLVDAFRGVEIVISAIGFRALERQKCLARAAKEAGVKIFVPSEYGGETHKTEGQVYFLAKKGIQEYLEEIKLPYTLFYTGSSPDFFLTSYACIPHHPFQCSFLNF